MTGELSNDTTTDTVPIEDNTTLPVVTKESVGEDAQALASWVRKVLIQATSEKNGSVRLSAFTLQKEIDAFVQSLANDANISNLEASAQKIEDMSRRLAFLEKKLHGSNAQ